MLITIGLFLAVVLLLLIGYIGDMIISSGDDPDEVFIDIDDKGNIIHENAKGERID